MQVQFHDNSSVFPLDDNRSNRPSNDEDEGRYPRVTKSPETSEHDRFESSTFTSSASKKSAKTTVKGQTKSGGINQGSSPVTKHAKSDTGSASELDSEEQKIVDQLKARDMEVRTHEQAHKNAGGQHVAGGPSFSYQTGPDGKQYAVGGEVQIDVSKVEGNPGATIQKAQAVQRAANAPAQPSAQDHSVASQASAMEGEAIQELVKERAEKAKGNNPGDVAGKDSEIGKGAKDTDSPAFDSVKETSGSSISAYISQVIQQAGEEAISSAGSRLNIFS